MNRRVAEYLAFKKGERRMPEHLKPKKEGESQQLFKNKFMEKLTHTPLWVPQAMYAVIITGMTWLGVTRFDLGIPEILLWTLGGVVTWTLAEYFIHRFFYHTESESEGFYKIQFNAHGIHHQFPKDDTRLAMPPVPSLILSSAFFGIFYLIMGVRALAFWPGFIIGYLAYITLHYYQHVVKSPKYGPWKKLWRHHRAHHYSDPYSAFGVTTRLWDWVFGTMPDYDKNTLYLKSK